MCVLRHTFCSHLAMQGAPARTIPELADLSTPQRYMHLSPPATEDAIRLLEARDGGQGRENLGGTLDTRSAEANQLPQPELSVSATH